MPARRNRPRAPAALAVSAMLLLAGGTALASDTVDMQVLVLNMVDQTVLYEVHGNGGQSAVIPPLNCYSFYGPAFDNGACYASAENGTNTGYTGFNWESSVPAVVGPYDNGGSCCGGTYAGWYYMKPYGSSSSYGPGAISGTLYGYPGEWYNSYSSRMTWDLSSTGQVEWADVAYVPYVLAYTGSGSTTPLISPVYAMSSSCAAYGEMALLGASASEELLKTAIKSTPIMDEFSPVYFSFTYGCTSGLPKPTNLNCKNSGSGPMILIAGNAALNYAGGNYMIAENINYDAAMMMIQTAGAILNNLITTADGMSMNVTSSTLVANDVYGALYQGYLNTLPKYPQTTGGFGIQITNHETKQVYATLILG
ncbi:hypothetical protein DFJ74DRAFT_650397 [Hyaloraphidium curvatum]|nr:hypothetical protein DFJ74DRAFT_650397 [Hyaloraphidium curvatum]